MKSRLCAVLALVVAGLHLVVAAPPKLDIPAEVRPVGGYVRFSPVTDAVSVTYVSLDGADPFPSEELRDRTRFLLPVAGLKDARYRFAAVGASKEGEQTRTDFVVVVGAGGKLPPDPTEPPVGGEPKLYFAIVRNNGPADAEFVKSVGNPAWDQLRLRGHQVKDFEFVAACKQGFCPPAGTVLPCVMTLRLSADGKTSTLFRGPVALPTDTPGILKLGEVKP